MDLTTAKVLVTGGSSGIGHETAKHLIGLGAKVAICGRQADKVQRAADELGALGLVADVSKEADVVRLVAEVIAAFGSFNVLVNNAAFGFFAPLTEMPTAQFEALFATNVTGAMMVARECAKHFVANQTGNIINVASTAGHTGFPMGTAYAASKFALRGMTECWRGELRKHNIRVMLVNPSEVQTNFVANSGREARPHNPTKLESQEIAHTIASLLAMHDRGFVTDVTVWATNPQ
jgi:3-oxoacyl-[acyl-carrier protein] reductase